MVYGRRSEPFREQLKRAQNSRKIAKPVTEDQQTDMLEKQAAKLQKQLTELQKKDQISLRTKLVAELEAQFTEAKSSTTTARGYSCL